jgi:hypothetical protein
MKEPSMEMTEKQKEFYKTKGWITKFVTKRMAIQRMASLFEKRYK